MDEITLEGLCGEHLFSGIEMTVETYNDGYWGERDCDICLFTFDGVTYKAAEDPDDGYRSYCRTIDVSDREPTYSFPAIKVFCHMMEDSDTEMNNVLVVRDILNGKTILEIGTKNTGDYYPYCHFRYIPENMACNSEKRN